MDRNPKFLTPMFSLGIEGVDLYGGTRHSTVTSLREYFSPEEIKGSRTLHTTNRAFDRYFQFQTHDAIKLYEIARNIDNERLKETKK